MKRILTAFTLISILCFLLLFPQAALASARDGLLLWYRNLVPVLLPFMILSSLMIRLDYISVLLKFLHPVLHLIWGTSVYGSYAILAGFLFGYPMGAKTVNDLLAEKKLSRAEADYLIGFVNNLSPAFIITFLVQQNLKDPALLHPTLCIIYGAPLLTSMVFAPGYRKAASASKRNAVSATRNKASKVPVCPELVDACITDGIMNITKLGVYIMLFALITGALNLLPIKNVLLRCLINGCVEVTSGVRYICEASLPFFTRYLCLMTFCSFGGICALVQTLSVFKMDRRTLTCYLKAKAVTVCVSLTLTCLLFL